LAARISRMAASSTCCLPAPLRAIDTTYKRRRIGGTGHPPSDHGADHGDGSAQGQHPVRTAASCRHPVDNVSDKPGRVSECFEIVLRRHWRRLRFRIRLRLILGFRLCVRPCWLQLRNCRDFHQLLCRHQAGHIDLNTESNPLA
jgi:hypothetical protein